MIEILASAAFGYAKGYAVGPRAAPVNGFSVHVAAPVAEEVMYRAGMKQLGGFASSAVFALDHVVGKGSAGMTPGQRAVRFADAFAGGILYHRAFAKYGLFGAIAAHMAHNVCASLGRSAGSNSRSGFGGYNARRRKTRARR